MVISKLIKPCCVIAYVVSEPPAGKLESKNVLVTVVAATAVAYDVTDVCALFGPVGKLLLTLKKSKSSGSNLKFQVAELLFTNITL